MAEKTTLLVFFVENQFMMLNDIMKLFFECSP